jgi:hypothetical protein
MGFNTTDLPVNFNDRFRKVFKTGIFWGGDVQASGLSVEVSPFVATTCDGGVVRDDVDTQTLAIPANRPDGVYVCLLARYRDFDEPQLEWKVVEASCLTSCENSDCFIIFALVRTGPAFISSIEKWGPHRLDQCNKEDLHTWPTVASLPTLYDGLVVGECAFVIETKQFYWWTGAQWLPVNCGGRTIVIVNITGDTVNIDASTGDIFVCNLTGPTTFAAPTNPVNGKLIEYWIYSDAYYPLTWDTQFMGTQATIPLITSGNGLAPYPPDRVVFECIAGHSYAEWLATFRDTNNIAIGTGAQTPEGLGNVAIGVSATTGTSTNSAVAIGNNSVVGNSAWNSIAINGVIGDTSYTSLAMCGGSIQGGAGASIAIGIGATIYTGAYSTVVIGGGSSSYSPYTLVLGSANAVADSGSQYGVVIGNGNTIDTGSPHSIVMGFGCSISQGSNNSILIGGTSQAAGAVPSAITQGGYDMVVIGNSNLSDAGNSNGVVIGCNAHVTGGSDFSIVLGSGDGTPFNSNPGATDPPGDFVYVGDSMLHSVVLGSKIHLDDSTTGCSFVMGRNIWGTSGSDHIVAIGETLFIEQGSVGAICIGGYTGGHLQNADGALRNHIVRSANCIAIGRALQIEDMGTPPDASPHTELQSASMVLGYDSILKGIGGYQGSNVCLGIHNEAYYVSRSIAIGHKNTIGTTGTATNYSIVIGGNSSVIGNSSIALGYNTHIGGGSTDASHNLDCIAIGAGAVINESCSGSIALGKGATVRGANSIAIGQVTTPLTDDICVIGGSSMDAFQFYGVGGSGATQVCEISYATGRYSGVVGTYSTSIKLLTDVSGTVPQRVYGYRAVSAADFDSFLNGGGANTLILFMPSA